jgi:Chalcone isomerase-like
MKPGKFLLLCTLLCTLVLQISTVLAKNLPEPAKLPQEINAALTPVQFSGTGKLTFFGLHVYDASLWVSPGFKANDFEDHAFALDLHYFRSFSGDKIARRSLEEMQRLEKIPEPTAELWLTTLSDVLPDIKKGDRLVGVHKPGTGVSFWHNGKRSGEIRDAEFSKQFFAIWLSPKTSEPKLRKALLGHVN